MINAILVDDEPLAREELRILLEQDHRYQIVAEFDNAVHCLSEYMNFNADVLFVDINMPKITGIELLKILTNKPLPKIVLVTAYENYALQAFEDAAFDYLLKPIDEQRLHKTLSRLSQTIQPNKKTTHLSLLPCYNNQQQQWIRCESIEYAFSDLGGIHIFDGNEHHHTQLTLTQLAQELGLIRCHRQYLIHPEAIQAITLISGRGGELTSRSGQKIPVSRRYLKALRELFALSN
ncbi:MAG: Transcriptional regulatory protein BtsR [Candidatus Celerinatantimonas neptuna]|nr:MAG: Transcriptional regulatory protein BtsR [Candidatus Celerinatantimonas neptuna]